MATLHSGAIGLSAAHLPVAIFASSAAARVSLQRVMKFHSVQFKGDFSPFFLLRYSLNGASGCESEVRP